MIDPSGLLLTGIRDTEAVAEISDRIRFGEPAPDDSAWQLNQATGKKTFKNRFAVLVKMPGFRLSRNAVQTIRYVMRAYGLTPQDATHWYGVLSDAAHNLNPRLNGSGIGIWNSRVIEDNGALRDPDTGQPYEEGVIEVLAPTQVVAA